MKKVFLTGFALAVLMLQTGLIPSAFSEEDAAKTQEILQAKKAELNGHAWDIKLNSSSDKKEAGEDTLLFKDMMFESKNNAEKGFKSTNYTISLQEGGPTVWETMQSDEQGHVIFWRGEWEADSMKGIMSKQMGEGKNEDYYFSSLGSKEIPKEEPKAEVPAEEVAAPAEEEAPAMEAPALEETVPAAEEAMEEEKSEAQEEGLAAEPVKEKSKKKWF